MKSIVFDLDGTLADTSGDLLAAANACFEALNLGAPLSHATDQATAFAGGRAMIRLGYAKLGIEANEKDVDQLFPTLLQFYDQHIDVHTTLYPGVETALDALAANGCRLGICTNKPEGLAAKLLDSLNIANRFHAMLGADTLSVRKPNPRHITETVARMGGSMSDAVLIGDTVNDREAARNAQIPCVLVLFGPEGLGIRRLDAEAYLPCFDDLEGVLLKLALAR
jgi:phosphoglycolate phosphatase